MALRDELLQFLESLPAIDSPGERQALFESIWPADITNELDWEGSRATFCTRLLDQFGRRDRSGLPVLLVKLAGAPQVGGVDRRAALDDLRAKIEGLNDAAWQDEFPKREQRVERGIGGDVVAIKIGTQLDLYLFGATGAFGTPAVAVRPPAAPPYKALKSYSFSERDDFHGRTALANSLASIILGEATTALIGNAGVGKTSLIQARLIPALGSSGDVSAFVVQNYSTPAARIREGLQLTPGLAVDLPQEESLAALTTSFAQATGRQVVIFFDQFERLLALPQARQDEFARQVAAAQSRDADARVHMVFVMRPQSRDTAALLQERVSDTNLLRNMQRVPGLDWAGAAEAIREPLHVPGGINHADMDESLISDWILPQLADVMPETDTEGRHLINPTPLQIVCEQLYERAKAGAKPGKQPQISLDLFKKMEETKGILTSDLNSRLQGLAGAAEVQAVRELLYNMAGAKTLQFCSLPDLARAIAQPETDVERWLAGLDSVGLVEKGEGAYALTAAYLADDISTWFMDETDQKRADEALARALSDWEYSHILTERSRLARIRRSLHFLTPAPSARALLLRSAVAYEADPGFWATQLALDVAAKDAVGRLEAGTAADSSARAVAKVLEMRDSDQPGAVSDAAVASPAPDARIASALALSALGRADKSLQRASTSLGLRLQALKALAWIQFCGRRDWPWRPAEPLIFAIVLLLRLRANRYGITALAASSSLFGFLLGLAQMIFAYIMGMPNFAVQLVYSMAVGVTFGTVVGASYGAMGLIAAPQRTLLRRLLRPLGIVLGSAIADAFLVGAGLNRWPGWPALMIGGLAGSGFAIANELALAYFPGDGRRRLLLGMLGFAATAGLAAIVTIWVASTASLSLDQRRVWQFAAGVNTILFSGFPGAATARMSYIFWNTVSGAIMGLGLAAGLVVGDWLPAGLRRSQDD